MTKVTAKVASGLFALSMICAPESASAVTFNFVAERAAVGSNIEANSTIETASMFETLTGTFSYDLTALDIDNDPNQGFFRTGTIQIDQFQFETAIRGTSTFIRPGFNQILISNREADLLFIDVLLGESSPLNRLLTSDALPDNLIPVSFLSNTSSGLLFGRDGENDNFASFDFTSITKVSAVPLPAGGILLLTSLAAVGAWRRRTRTQKQD